MLFITVGTQKFQLNRLLKKMDYLTREFNLQDVYAQIGNSTYEPKNYDWDRFIDANKFNEILENADLIITHSGVGTIVKALQLRKRVIVVPRLKEYREHVDNHQIEIARAFETKHLVAVCYNIDYLYETIDFAKTNQFSIFQPNNQNFIGNIDTYLESLI